MTDSQPVEPKSGLELPGFARPAGRFAPTPTGDLHLGNARTALLSWLWARSEGRRNILRVEDLDRRAIPDGCLEGQYADLDWLGLAHDEDPRLGGPAAPYRQSERFPQYDVVLGALGALGVLYPCWCSRKEVAAAARAPHASDEGPVYPGTCRPDGSASLGDLSTLPERRGRPAAVRIDVARALARLGQETIDFSDAIAGPQRFDLARSMGDFVVRRRDGVAAYQVACAWDDVAMGCDQVLRGSDLLPSTARQLLILRVLGLPEPRYAHVGLVVAADGSRLAKRDRSTTLRSFREAGRDPSVVRAALAASAGLPGVGDLERLAAAFDLGRLPAGPGTLPSL